MHRSDPTQRALTKNFSSAGDPGPVDSRDPNRE